MAIDGTMTRADLAEALHRRIGLSRAESSNLVEGILRHMCASLSNGHNVKLSGFGSFLLRDKGERVGRNPKTGVEVPIAPRRVLTFRASQTMRDAIAQAAGDGAAKAAGTPRAGATSPGAATQAVATL